MHGVAGIAAAGQAPCALAEDVTTDDHEDTGVAPNEIVPKLLAIVVAILRERSLGCMVV